MLQLCPGSRYLIKAPILFAFPGQEISTSGYPVGDERATLVVSGPTTDGQGHTIAVDGTCANCSRVKLRHVQVVFAISPFVSALSETFSFYAQIDGNRGGGPPTKGGANIEMGGSNSDQIIEFVRSVDPRDWSCMHIAEGDLTCRNVIVQNNDIGPCGSDNYQEWADGVSLACSDSIVQNNMIQGATDGGIVIFGSPGSLIYNNTIWITNVSIILLRMASFSQSCYSKHCSVVLIWLTTHHLWEIILMFLYTTISFKGGFPLINRNREKNWGLIPIMPSSSAYALLRQIFLLRIPLPQDRPRNRTSHLVWRSLWKQRFSFRHGNRKFLQRCLQLRHWCNLSSEFHYPRQFFIWKHVFHWCPGAEL